MSKQPRPRGPKTWRSLQEARIAGQLELFAGRSVDPRIKAAKAEEAALRRQRRRKRRMGVFA
jgi:hypothetical protein